MDDRGIMEKHDPRVLALKGGLLVVWAAVAFGVPWFARDLQFAVGPWPFDYWFIAQGALLAFIAIVVAYAWAMRRLAPEDSVPDAGGEARQDRG
jgi:putative solute:sodium symporter small subunit